MTAPYGFTPEGAYTPASLPAMQSLTEEKIRARLRKPVDDAMGKMAVGLRDGLVSNIGRALRGEGLPGFESVRDAVQDGLLPGIADAVRGVVDLPGQYTPIRDATRALIRPVEDRVDTLSAEQLEVLERLVGLEDRRGFVQGYQARNYQHGGGGATILTTWNQSGPAHGAIISTTGMTLSTPGVWTVHFQCFGEATSSGTGFGVRDEVTAELTILISPNPSGPILRQYVKELAAQGGTGKVSLSVSFPVVVPEGHDVVIVPRVYSARRRRFLGGERYSALSAVKRDVETGPQGEETVPDA